MLIVLNDFGLSTYVLPEKRWIGGLHDPRENNTLTPSIYFLCWYLKTTVYVYPMLLLLCLCAPLVNGSRDLSYQNSLSVPRSDQDSCTYQLCWLSKIAMLQDIGIALSLGSHRNTWFTTLIVDIPYTCVEWTTLVVDNISIPVNYKYTRWYDYNVNYCQKRGIAFHKNTRRTATSFPLAVCPCQNNNWMQQSNKKMVRWNWPLRRTNKRYVDPYPRRSIVNLLIATAWIQTGGLMRGFECHRHLHRNRKVH